MLNYDFDWSVLWREPYGRMLLEGIRTTIHLSIFSWAIASILGLTVGICRILPSRLLQFLGGVYVEIFRNVPLLVQLFFWYFAFPSLLPRSAEQWLYREVSSLSYLLGMCALGAYTASRVAEVVRTGFMAVPRGQVLAAQSTGLTPWKTIRYVVLPYAFRIMLPLLTTEFLTCFKNSALTMTIGVMETTGMANYIDSFTFHGLETTTAASVVYLTTSTLVIFFMGLLERRLRIPGMMGRQ